MSYECFDVDIHEHIAHVQLSRPEKRNSMIPAFWRELPELMAELDQPGQVRVIVLSSSGPHFTAGMDLSVFSAESDAPTDPLRDRQRAARFHDLVLQLQRSFTCLEQVRVPVLAAVQGGCIGAGVDLVTACDIRYATADAFFIIQETNIAMTADVGTFPRICTLIPDGMVRELAYTGRALPAAEAKELGLINAIYDSPESLLEGVLEIATTIASKAPMAVYGCKQMILYARDHSTADTLNYVGLWNASYFQLDEITEAMHANREKREGRFTPLPEQPIATGSGDAMKIP